MCNGYLGRQIPSLQMLYPSSIFPPRFYCSSQCPTVWDISSIIWDQPSCFCPHPALRAPPVPRWYTSMRNREVLGFYNWRCLHCSVVTKTSHCYQCYFASQIQNTALHKLPWKTVISAKGSTRDCAVYNSPYGSNPLAGGVCGTLFKSICSKDQTPVTSLVSVVTTSVLAPPPAQLFSLGLVC